MIAQNFEYTRAKSLSEALSLLADGGAKALGGGMSLIPLMKLRLAAPERVIDLTRIPELNYIREGDGALHIGATVTHWQIESSAAVREHCRLLAETASRIGDPQVRNRGTLGGAVAHADPAADYPATLLALDAKVVLAGANGERTLSYEEFVIDTFTTALEPGEIVREIVVPYQDASEGCHYEKVVQPASGFAIVGIAVRVRKGGAARVGVTGLAAKAYRATTVEAALQGGADAGQAAATIADGVEANSDLYATADYRKHLARVHGARAIAAALSRAK